MKTALKLFTWILLVIGWGLGLGGINAVLEETGKIPGILTASEVVLGIGMLMAGIALTADIGKKG